MDALQVTYRVQVDARDVEARAEALLLEQTVELPRAAVRDPRVVSEILGSVEELAPDSAGGFRVRIHFPALTTASDPAQLLNVLFGNSSLQEDVELVDAEFPPPFVEHAGGPRFGLAGLRELTGVRNRRAWAAFGRPSPISQAAIASFEIPVASATSRIVWPRASRRALRGVIPTFRRRRECCTKLSPAPLVGEPWRALRAGSHSFDSNGASASCSGRRATCSRTMPALGLAWVASDRARRID